MRTTKVQFTRNDRAPKRFISRVTAIILLVLGVLMVQPFFWVVIVGGVNFHYITIPVLFMILLLMFGLPMTIAGFIGLLIGDSNASTSAYNEHDVSRVRYAVEEEMRRK